MNIKLFFTAVWKKKWILILIPLICALAVFFLTKEENIYTSKAQLATGFTAGINGESEEAQIKFENLIESIHSPLIIGIFSYELLLHDLEEEVPFRKIEDESALKALLSPAAKESISTILRKKIAKFDLLNASNDQERRIIELCKAYNYDYQSLSEKIKVSRINLSDNASIVFQSENPQLSAFAVNTIAALYIRYNNSLDNKVSGQSIDYYSNLVNKTKEILDQKTLELNNFKESNNVINVDVQSGSKFNQLAELELRREQENRNMKKHQLELENINKQLSGLIQGPAISSRGRDNNRIAELQSKIKEANQRYIASDRDPAILSIVEDLRRQLQIELGKTDITPASIENRRNELLAQKNTAELNLQITQAALNQINSAIRGTQSNVSGLTTKGATLESLTREVEKANEEYLAALQKYNASKNETLISTTSIRQVIYGQPALRPEPSDTIKYTILAALGSFAVCLIFIVIGVAFDPSVKTASAFIRKTNMEPVGYINVVKTAAITPEILNSRQTGKEDNLALFKELLKKLRFEVESSGSKVFLFTSSRAADGKTSLIISLASALVASGKKVLLIDTNFKNNTLTKAYSAKPSLETAVSKGLSPDEFITKTNYQNLDIIGCKGGNYSPSEIFPERKLGGFLSQLTPLYDYVFLEGTYLNQYADSKELVAYSDKVIGVFSAQSAFKQSDKESFNYLKGLNSKFLGVVLNKVDHAYIDL